MFTHLHVHSDNSVLDGYGTIDEYINKAKEYNQNALALTDHNTLTGIYTFINKCRKQGIKGIAGCEINLAPNNNAKLKEYIQYGNNKYVLNNGVNTHLTLLAKNHNGLLNLFQIIYHSYKSENFFNVPRIDLNILKQFSKDLICLSGCPNSEINIRLRMNDIEKAENEALQLKEIFGQDFYIEIMSMRGEPNYNIEKLIDLALKLKIQPVLTNDIHYANKSDSNIHEKILAIGRKAKMEETPTTMGGLRYKFADNEYYFKNEDEMKNSLFNRLKQTRFDDKTIQIIINSCIKNTQVISDKIEEIKFEYNPTLRNKPFLPKEFTSSFDYLKYLVKQGFEKKRRNSSDEVKAISLQKQEEELETIYANDFVDYFIVVKDYIDWTRANGGGVGGGRGSVGGSEIAYLLDISRTDPIRFGLMFERFISPGRGATFRICYNDNTQEDINIANKKITNHGEKYIYQLNQGDIVIEDTEKVITEITIIDAGSSPDIDTDFQTDIREKTIEYVSQKYGVQNSSHLITHGKFGVKNAFRSLCQIYSDIPSTKVNEISKMLPDLKEDEEDDLKDITLADYIEENGRLYNKGTAIRLAIDTPRLKEIAIETDKLIGRKRDTGVHACGVVMSQNPLIENIPLQIKHDKNSDMTITQWTYQECEELGIIKMDFLGLDTIDLMENTVKLIKKTKNIDINLEEIIYGKLDDEEVFKLFQDGNTFGIFQFGEEGVRELLRSVHPTEFEELAAITALYRPGPMGMNLHTEFAKRKNDINSRIPVHPSFKNTDLEKILNSTFGACTYQEQIMQISKVCAGFSPKDADGLRKAMGKKKVEVLNKYETQFKQGMNEHGYTDTNAVNILWDGMVGFAKYAFNKSHAISYALNSYTCAYLKVHYPTEFMSVLLQQKFGDDDISKYLNETKRLGIEIIPPNINTSMLVMTPIEDYKISYGLKCIKSLSDKDIENIYYEREKNGKYKDIIDFIQRNNISGTMLKTLSMAGCLDCFGITRKGIYEECNDIVKKAEKLKKDKNINFLFNFIDNNNIVTKNYKEWCNSEKIRNEAIATGLYISGNPVDNITLKSGRVIENQTELDKIDCDCTQLVTITMKPIIKKNKKGQNYFMFQLNNGTSEIKEFVKGNIINRIMLFNALSKVTDYKNEQDRREKAYQKLNLNEESKVVFNQIKPLENLQVYKVYKATYKTYKTGDIVRKSLEDLEPLLISENNRELKEIYFNGDSSKIEKLIAFLKKESLKYNKSDLSDIILYDNKLNSIVVNDVIINGSIFQISKGKLSDKPF